MSQYHAEYHADTTTVFSRDRVCLLVAQVRKPDFTGTWKAETVDTHVQTPQLVSDSHAVMMKQ